MKQRSFFPRFLLISVCACAISCNGGRYETFSGYAQGGTWRVKVRTGRLSCGNREIAAGIEGILESIDTTISGYNRNSLLSRFNAGERIRPNELFLELYEQSFRYHEISGGAFDVAAGPLFDIWGFGFRTDSLPSDERVAEALAASGMKRLRRDIRGALDAGGMLCASDLLLDGGPPPILNFNAIAQGYSCDLVADYLRSAGAEDMLVDIGEIRCEGVNPSGKGWSVGIDNPVDGNNVPGADMREEIWDSMGKPRGVVTSGNYRKFYVRDGVKYSHTIDPRTGRPVTHDLLSATVTAPDASCADALATACMVLGMEKARELVLSVDGVEAFLIGSQTSWRSDGFTLRK